jgi:superfamily I DNA/RNA helicase
MHRARHLATRVFTRPDDRLLFTTYTANLALDVQENLGNLCGPERDRIDVVHLHAWAVRFLKARGIEVDIATEDDLERCWRLAIDHGGDAEFDPGFLRQEWDQVVLAGNLRSLPEYLRASRTGRGRTLSRPQRGRAWAIFERYRQALAALGKQEWLGVIRQTRTLLDDAGQAPPYRAVIVDEAQDFHAEEWRLIRSLAAQGPDDLFVVGDAHQRIYGRKVVLGQCGVAIQGRSSRLRINYRTTEQIRGWATTLLHGVEADDLDGDRDDDRGDRSLLSGPTPEISHFKTRPDEKEHLAEAIRGLLEARPPEEICLVARTAKLIRDDYEPMLRAAGVPSVVLDRGREKSAGKVRLATMHRVKGLEFPVMILAGINANVVPLRLPGVGDDPASRAEHEDRERSLLYVAATRARDRLLVTSWGTPSPFLAR